MRRTKVVTISSEDRDNGKMFLITEMSSVKAEKWAARVLLALMKSGLQIPDDMSKAGMAGVAALGPGLLSGALNVSWAELEPLLDEMLTCVKVPKPDVEHPRPLMWAEGAEDIEEVATLLTLRKEVLELHMGFSFAERLASSATPAQVK